MTKWLVAFTLAQVLDVASTYWAVQHECREAIWPSVHAAAVAKTVGVGLVWTMGARMDPGDRKAVAVLGLVTGSVGAVWNLSHCR